ncbi:hypothetical protein D3C86_2071610 [compost metagenome]
MFATRANPVFTTGERLVAFAVHDDFPVRRLQVEVPFIVRAPFDFESCLHLFLPDHSVLYLDK